MTSPRILQGLTIDPNSRYVVSAALVYGLCIVSKLINKIDSNSHDLSKILVSKITITFHFTYLFISSFISRPYV